MSRPTLLPLVCGPEAVSAGRDAAGGLTRDVPGRVPGENPPDLLVPTWGDVSRDVPGTWWAEDATRAPGRDRGTPTPSHGHVVGIGESAAPVGVNRLPEQVPYHIIRPPLDGEVKGIREHDRVLLSLDGNLTSPAGK